MTKLNLNDSELHTYLVYGLLENRRPYEFTVLCENEKVAQAVIYYKFEEINQGRRKQLFPSHKVASMTVEKLGVSA